MAAMTNTRANESVVPSNPAVSPSMSAGVSMKPGISPTSLPVGHHQAGLGMKPGPQSMGPSPNVLQVVKQVQEEAARQSGPQVGGFGKVNPGGMGVGLNIGTNVLSQPGGVMPPPQMQRPSMSMPMPNAGGPHLMPIDQWQSPNNFNRFQPNAVMNQGLRQQNPQLLQQQLTTTAAAVAATTGATGSAAAAATTAGWHGWHGTRGWSDATETTDERHGWHCRWCGSSGL